MKLTLRISRQARNWKGQEQHWELRGNVYFKQEITNVERKCFLITKSSLTSLSRGAEETIYLPTLKLQKVKLHLI
jgi:hypothetical protein